MGFKLDHYSVKISPTNLNVTANTDLVMWIIYNSKCVIRNKFSECRKRCVTPSYEMERVIYIIHHPPQSKYIQKI